MPNFDLNEFLTPFVVLAIILTVLFSELVKKLDKKDKFKGYRVYFPLFFSALFTLFLWLAEAFTIRQAPLYWFAILGFSMFGYEAIVKKITSKIESIETTDETIK
jgi:hypothetical protein